LTLQFSPSDPTSNDNEPEHGKNVIPQSMIPKLVDNKRKHMEKRLSQAQRDQVLMNSAKEDVIMKKSMMEMFEKSNKTLEDSITKMTTCLTSLGEGIAAGMQMLAMALSQNQAPAPHHPGPAFPVTQAQPNMYPGHYSGYVQHNHQFTSSTSTRNQSSLPTTHGAVSAANQTLYDFGDDGSMYNSRS